MRKFNKKKFLKTLFFLILIMALISICIYFFGNKDIRDNTYAYYEGIISKLFSSGAELKNVEEIFSLQYDPAIQTTITTGKDGVLVINKSGISEYTTSNTPVWVRDFSMQNPIIDTFGGRFVIGESNGKKLIAFENRNKIWEYELKNEIKKVFINKEGFVGVIFAQTGYKSGFLFLNPEGKEICTKLFAKTTLIDLDISPNGKSVAMIEADTSSATVSSAVSFLSDKGEIVHSSLENDILLSGIRFMDNNNVVCVGDTRLIKIDKNYQKTVLDDFTNKKVSGINFEVSDRIIKIYREANSIFADKSVIEVTNVNNKKTGTGEVAGVVKEVEALGKTIAVILADRVDFFDINGKYLNSLSISGKFKTLRLFDGGIYACLESSDSIKVVKVR